jgi:hypothetical protein
MLKVTLNILEVRLNVEGHSKRFIEVAEEIRTVQELTIRELDRSFEPAIHKVSKDLEPAA